MPAACTLHSGQHAVGCFSSPGNRYGEVLNQDYTAVETPPLPDPTLLLAVCDGHGVLGEKAACYAGKALVRSLFSATALRSMPLSKMSSDSRILEEVMKAAFAQGHRSGLDLYENPPSSSIYLTPGGRGVEPYSLARTSRGGSTQVTYRSSSPAHNPQDKPLECGTTATVAIVQGRTVCIANVGDTQAVLGTRVLQEGSGISYRTKVLSTLHNCSNNSEAERITLKHGDNVKAMKSDGYLQVNAGPCMGMQLSVTRALCHKNLQPFGVIPEPDVSVHTLGPDDCCLVLASDGVFDHVSPAEVVMHVMTSAASGASAAQCAKALVEHAVQKGLSSPQREADNTSAIVVLIK